MKKKHLLSLAALLAIAILFINASGGPALIQQRDRTGSPLSNNSDCSTCHNSGSFNPTISLSLEKDGIPVDKYIPGESYDLRISVMAMNDPAGYGFQAVALMGDNHDQAGSFGTPPENTQITELNNREYVEHSTVNTDNEWTIPWVAPADGGGDISFYAAGNAVNRASGPSGDSGVRLDSALVITEQPSGVSGANPLNVAINIFPNPASDFVHVHLKSATDQPIQLSIIDVKGQELYRHTDLLDRSQNEMHIDLDRFSAGTYWVLLTDGQRVSTKKLLVQ